MAGLGAHPITLKQPWASVRAGEGRTAAAAAGGGGGDDGGCLTLCVARVPQQQQRKVHTWGSHTTTRKPYRHGQLWLALLLWMLLSDAHQHWPLRLLTVSARLFGHHEQLVGQELLLLYSSYARHAAPMPHLR
jgi:hypothetical protein